LFIGAIALGLMGCDGKSTNVQERFADDRAATAEIKPDSGLDVRVLLSRASEIWLNCQNAPYAFWDGDQNKQWISLETAQSCLLRRQNGIWQVKDKFGRDLLPVELRRAKSLVIKPKKQAILDITTEQKQRYRGWMRIWAEDENLFAVVNVVDIEQYLAGVVGAEMPSWWYKAALRAQCVASRTYALYQLHLRGNSGRWDLADDQSSQVYGGVIRESRRVNEAVNETHGVVLVSNWKGKEKIFPTYYSSTCGGHTQDAAAVFGENLPPLKGTACPYCGKVARREKYRWSGLTIAKEDISKRLIKRYSSLADLDRIVDVKVVARSEYGRVEKLELIGKNGHSRNIGAEDFRLAVSTREKPLLSSWYKLIDAGKEWRFDDGHGWGHGVGMCQCGSQQMALLGNDSIAILKHYYPQAIPVRAY
jgi:SpoIID/LytB domain protein